MRLTGNPLLMIALTFILLWLSELVGMSVRVRRLGHKPGRS
jgi:hypothetical protein